MAGARTAPPLSTQSQNAADSVDIVNQRFVAAALTGSGHSPSSDANLITNLRTALTEASFSREDIDETLSQFDPTLSISQYYNQTANLGLVKAKGKYFYVPLFICPCLRFTFLS